MSDDIEAILRLADLPRPAGEQHEMNPPHDLCLGDDPCICIHLAACEQRVEESMSRAWQQTVDMAVAHTRVSTLDAAREAVASMIIETVGNSAATVDQALAVIDALGKP